MMENKKYPACSRGSRPELMVVEDATFEVNNDRRIRVSQREIDGPVAVRILSAPDDVYRCRRHIESEYEITPGDFVMMLNWYRYQKAQGNNALMF